MTKVSIWDFAIFQIKLVIDGLKDGAVFTVSFIAFGIDLVFRRYGRRRFFYKVMRVSEKFGLWLNWHRASEGAERDGMACLDRARGEVTRCLVRSSTSFEGSMNCFPVLVTHLSRSKVVRQCSI